MNIERLMKCRTVQMWNNEICRFDKLERAKIESSGLIVKVLGKDFGNKFSAYHIEHWN